MTRTLCRPLLLAALLVLLPGTARAAFVVTVTPTITPPASPGGLYHYEYLLENDPTSDQAAIVFTLDVSTAADLTNITRPAGWDIVYLPLVGNITWSSTDPAWDIQPGQSLQFGFDSPLAPRDQLYAVFGENLDTVEAATSSPGEAVVSAVPAPAGFLLAAVGICSLGGYGWRKRRACAS